MDGPCPPLFLGPFVSAVHIHVSRREGDWPMHDIGLEEIAFFFFPSAMVEERWRV